MDFPGAIRRERITALLVVFVVAALCWAWLGRMVWNMSVMPMDPAGGMAMTQVSGPGYALWLIVMWAVMMAAMMVPSAAPVTLAFADFSGRDQSQFDVRPVAAFIGGYVLAWGAFSLAAGLAQWLAEQGAMLSPMTMTLKSDLVSGLVLIAAGLYQWTPLKQACLRKCRTPIGFLMTEWRDGIGGAVMMGWRHGAYCIGCCWALMALLFVVGVMNVVWIIGLMLFVIAEKTLPFEKFTRHIVGALLIAAGLGVMTGLVG